MTVAYPTSWSALQYPWIRVELLSNLEELSAMDPRQTWSAALAQGLAAGVDEVIHFFFDDHDFAAEDIGLSLFDEDEVALVGALKERLNGLIEALPRGGNDEYVAHPLWPTVRQAAVVAHDTLKVR